MKTESPATVISRRHLFSTAHLYEQKAFTPEQNQKTFGACYTQHGHGHNYVIEAFAEGPLDPATGLVMNVTDLDIILKKVCAPFDHQHINHNVPTFYGSNNPTVVPTTEHLSSYLFGEIEKGLATQAPGLKLNRIRLFETDDLWAETRRSPTATKPIAHIDITSQLEIRSIHHLENPFWTEDENKKVYGICYGTHGHNYQVQVTLTGPLDEESGTVMDRDAIDAVLQREIVGVYDGVDLNERFTNTSCEALAIEFFGILEPHFEEGQLKRVGIQETQKNYFEFPPAS